jgi:hypothetical protein
MVDSNFSTVEQNHFKKIYRAKTPRQSDGQSPSSRANARDLKKISPVGRNDTLASFASLRSYLFPILQSKKTTGISNIFG